VSRYRRRSSGHKDSNHDAVVRELRQGGASVLETHGLGDGAPDLVVGYQGVTALVEVKNGARYHQNAGETPAARTSAGISTGVAWRPGVRCGNDRAGSGKVRRATKVARRWFTGGTPWVSTELGRNTAMPVTTSATAPMVRTVAVTVSF